MPNPVVTIYGESLPGFRSRTLLVFSALGAACLLPATFHGRGNACPACQPDRDESSWRCLRGPDTLASRNCGPECLALFLNHYSPCQVTASLAGPAAFPGPGCAPAGEESILSTPQSALTPEPSPSEQRFKNDFPHLCSKH